MPIGLRLCSWPGQISVPSYTSLLERGGAGWAAAGYVSCPRIVGMML